MTLLLICNISFSFQYYLNILLLLDLMNICTEKISRNTYATILAIESLISIEAIGYLCYHVCPSDIKGNRFKKSHIFIYFDYLRCNTLISAFVIVWLSEVSMYNIKICLDRISLSYFYDIPDLRYLPLSALFSISHITCSGTSGMFSVKKKCTIKLDYISRATKI